MIVTITPNPVLDHTLTVPEIAFDTVTRATTVRDDWGGKGFNVSRVLLALGVESTALGFVGGATGQRLAAGLAALGLPTDFVTVAGETRTNVVIAEADNARYVKVNEAGPMVQPEEIAQFLDKVQQRAAPGDTWALCGSLPPGVPDDFYAQLIEILQPRGVRVLLDTSGAALRLGCEARPFLVKPNAEEAAAFAGHPIETRGDAQRAARAFLERGVTQVALSLGGEGLLLATRESAVFATPPDVAAKNVTGAGDALLAGLAYALERGLPLAEQARWGVAAGTASAMHEGVGIVTRESLDAVFPRIRVLDPLALDQVESATKGLKCSFCGSERCAEILYGRVAATEQLRADLASGKVVLGGCLVHQEMPRWRCLDCGKAW